MDPIFAFAFIQALLRRLPGPLAQRVEKVCADRGFDTLLSAYFASTDAMEHLLRSVSRAVLACETIPATIDIAKRRISDGVSLGMALPGQFELSTKQEAFRIMNGIGRVPPQ